MTRFRFVLFAIGVGIALNAVSQPVPTLEPLEVAAWEADLDIARVSYADADRSFSPEAREQFLKALDDLKVRLPDLNCYEAMIALARAAALTDNAHSGMAFGKVLGQWHSLPIKAYWFSDGLYVVKAVPEHSRLIGSEITHVAGHDVTALRERLGEVVSGNQQRLEYLFPDVMLAPEVLLGFGLINELERLEVSFKKGDGAETVVLETLSPQPHANRLKTWQHLSPQPLDEDRKWIKALEPLKGNVPLYLTNPLEAYWINYLEDSKTVYFQYNASETVDGKPIARFMRNLLTLHKELPIDRFVIDLRFNAGGDLYVAKRYFELIARHDTYNRQGRIFVLVSRATYSAGIFHAAQLQQDTNAIIVGEPVADELDFWAEGKNIELPNTGLILRASDGFHSYSKEPYGGEAGENLYLNLEIDSLTPEIPVPFESGPFFAGEDPYLSAALSFSG